MNDFIAPFAFERSSNILSFSRNTLPIKNNPTHLFIPWTTEFDNELMFKIKKTITESGNCLIPFFDLNMKATSLAQETVSLLSNQIESNIETHLVMSNGDSIHIFKITSIQEGSLNSKDQKRTTDVLAKKNFKKTWVEVSDVYVYKANHDQGSSIEEELKSLIHDEQKGYYFTPMQKLNIQNEVTSEPLNWIKSQRNLTYDYFVRSCELEENIFQESWKDLNHRSRHCLISFEQIRHKALLHKEKEKFSLLKEALELYLSALLNELNEVYISPFAHTFSKYSCLQEAWGDVKDGLVNPELRLILEKTYLREDKQLTSLEDFLAYVETIKSCLFSLKNRFSKKIGKEEYLLVENFLTKQENMIESLISRELDHKIKSLVKVKNWLSSLFDRVDDLSCQELKSSTLKLTHILSILSSTNYEDNVFFKILEEKTSKGFVRRTFEDEVNSLVIPKVLIAA